MIKKADYQYTMIIEDYDEKCDDGGSVYEYFAIATTIDITSTVSQ